MNVLSTGNSLLLNIMQGGCTLLPIFVYIVIATKDTSNTGKTHGFAQSSYQQLSAILDAHPALYGYRDGNASESHYCRYVREVPSTLRHPWAMKPNGISQFYEKYTEAYGIPVVASKHVSNHAIMRACYVLRFLLAGHSSIRQSYYRLFGRVAVIGANEQVTDIPEYSFLDSAWNKRTRGVGAFEIIPVSSGAEENLLCDRSRDRYSDEDIFLHELSHGLHLLGAKYAIPGWQENLTRAFNKAKLTGLWANTYSMSTAQEYLAEGVQSYFGANAYSATPNGVHGPVDSRQKLLEYDPDLYWLIDLLFPCGNDFLRRCQSTRAQEAEQVLNMNCDLTAEYQSMIPKYIQDDCVDDNFYCSDWAAHGECEINPTYMQLYCKKSCSWCDKPPSGETTSNTGCRDDNQHCKAWASLGECQQNPTYMTEHCKLTCHTC